MTTANHDRIMAVDVGVTNVKVGLVDNHGQISEYVQKPTEMDKGAGGSASVLVSSCREVLQRANLSVQDPVAVGCSVPGNVNPDTGIIVSSATPGWIGVDIREPLENSFDREVAIEGDGAASTLAAYTFGPTRGHNNLLGLCVGTSTSCGYILDGEIMRGAGQASMEAGHMHLFSNGKTCSCGSKGCWQAHAGGSALRTILGQVKDSGVQIPSLPEEISELAHANHEESLKIWEKQGELLGLGIGILLNILNPRTVVLSGGILKSWALFKKSLLKTAREKSLSRQAEAAIMCAPDPERAALLGAAVCGIRHYGLTNFFVDHCRIAT